MARKEKKIRVYNRCSNLLVYLTTIARLENNLLFVVSLEKFVRWAGVAKKMG